MIFSLIWPGFLWSKHQGLINKKTEVMKNQGNTLKLISKKRENEAVKFRIVNLSNILF